MKDIITRIYNDQKTCLEAQEIITRCYSEDISIEKIKKMYKKLDNMTGHFNKTQR